MASREKKKIESSLKKKGFTQEKADHNYFVYVTFAGKKTLVKTKTSHTPKMKTVGDAILSKMASQCHLSKNDFLSLIDCPMERDKYEKHLQDKNLLD
jgi:hypothetical protein